MLDDLDKELEKRGHCFVRYADVHHPLAGSLTAHINVAVVGSQERGLQTTKSLTH